MEKDFTVAKLMQYYLNDTNDIKIDSVSTYLLTKNEKVFLL